MKTCKDGKVTHSFCLQRGTLAFSQKSKACAKATF